MIWLPFAAAFSAVNPLVGPAVVAPVFVSPAAATSRVLAVVVATVGVVTLVPDPIVGAGAPSNAVAVATPENSLTFTPPPTCFRN
jgi:hypothetical protein